MKLLIALLALALMGCEKVESLQSRVNYLETEVAKLEKANKKQNEPDEPTCWASWMPKGSSVNCSGIPLKEKFFYNGVEVSKSEYLKYSKDVK